MTTTEIRPLQGEELIDVLYQLNSYAFHPSPPFREKEPWAEIVRRRVGMTYLVVFENGRPVSGAMATPQTHHVRGRLFKTAGVWGVATAPEARKKGYCRQAMAELLATEHTHGVGFSCLYPFRESFYERLGYCAFPLTQVVKLSPRTLLPALKMDLPGEVEQHLAADAYPAYRSYVEGMLAVQHGMTLFDNYDVEAFRKNNPSWLALAKVDGQVEGVMVYLLQGPDVGKFTMRGVRFYYTTRRARYLLLGWIARHVDQAEWAELTLAPAEAPETWLADLELQRTSADRPAMGRVLDVGGLGGMQAGVGSFSARIRDPLCPWNEGVWRFTGQDGRLEVSPGGVPECELTIQGLSSLLYGIHDPADFEFRGWGSPPAAVQAVMRSLFPPAVPYMHEMF